MSFVKSGFEVYLVFKLGDTLEKINREALILALEHNDWNQTKAAAALGLNRTTLYMRMKALNLNREEVALEMASL